MISFLAACGGAAAKGPDADPTVTCAAIEADFEAALADSGTCDADADCEVIGGQLGGDWTCDCATAIGACGGNAIERNAPGLARAQHDISEFAAQCAGFRAICDCPPAGDVHCSNHRCSADPYANSCFPQPDAGP